MSEYQRHRRQNESDSFFCRFTFGQFFAILLLEVFTLFFVFYLGARYGGEFLGLETKSSTAIVADQSQSTQQQADQQVQSTTDPEVVAMAEELIAKAKTPELKEKIARMLTNANNAKKVVPNEAVQLKPAPTLVKQKVTQQRPSDVVKVKTTQKAVSQPSGVVRVKSAAGARYSIQVGSYPDLDEANQQVDRWRIKGYPAYMMIADIPDRGRWYRVRVGGFGSKNAADDYKQDLVIKERVEALVVLNEQ